MYAAANPSSDHKTSHSKRRLAASRRPPRTPSYALENLEPRQLMSASVLNGSLNVYDTPGRNGRVTLDANPATREITLNDNGIVSVYRNITQVNVDGGDGLDIVNVLRTLPNVPTMINFTQGTGLDSVTIGMSGSTLGIQGPVTIGALLPSPLPTGGTDTPTGPGLPGTDPLDFYDPITLPPLGDPLLPPPEIREGTGPINVTVDDSRNSFSRNVTLAPDASNHLAITGMSPAVVNYVAGRVTRVTLRLGAGHDTLNPSTVPTDIFAYGGLGNDRLTGGHGSDQLYGGGNNDTLHGGVGRDRLFGETGIDTLTGISGEDVLSGGPENDFLNVTFNLKSFINGRGATIAPLSEYSPGVNGLNPNGTDLVDVKLDLRSFVHDGVIPTLEQVKRSSQDLKRAVDTFHTASNIISTIKFVTGLNPFEAYENFQRLLNNPLQPLVDQLDGIHQLQVAEQSGLIAMGRSTVSSAGILRVDSFNPFQNSSFNGTIAQLNDLGLRFSVFNDASAATNLAFGKNVDLFTCTFRSVDTGIKLYSGSFSLLNLPVIGGISLSATASLGFKAGGGLGVDLAGVRAGSLLGGFFATPDMKAAVSVGLTLSAEAEVIGWGGSINFSLDAQLTYGWIDADRSGKVRISEMTSGFARSVSLPYRAWVRLTSFFGLKHDDIEILSGTIEV
jgi:hypothetical protein